MKRREFLKIATVGAVCPLLQSCSTFDIVRPGKGQPNILFIITDDHHPTKVGYRGDPHVKTPNLDKMAAQGTYFTRAYSNCPICGPCRASLMTGKYVHQIGSWDNSAVSWTGREATWAGRLEQAGFSPISYGKIGTGTPQQDAGFTFYKRALPGALDVFSKWPLDTPRRERLKGWPGRWGEVDRAGTREDGLKRLVENKQIKSPEGLHIGFIGDTGQYDTDRVITDWTREFLRRKRQNRTQPWALHVGLRQPHVPYICPKKYFDMYYPNNFSLPHDAHFPNENLHPAVRHFQSTQGIKQLGMTEDKLRKIAAAYYGSITCMDEMIGEILDELKKQGLYDNTYIIYTSDHGLLSGEHGLFRKYAPYEDSAGIPLIIMGPGIPAGKRIDMPVSLIDIYPTIMEMAGLQPETEKPGNSLLGLIHGTSQNRPDYAFSEYHAGFFRHDWYMLVRGDYKYIYYAKERPSLFNVKKDPLEMNDIAQDPKYAQTLEEFEKLLRSICDPDEVANRAKRDLGLIGPNGEDYTETLTFQECKEGVRTGRFRPGPKTGRPVPGPNYDNNFPFLENLNPKR